MVILATIKKKKVELLIMKLLNTRCILNTLWWVLESTQKRLESIPNSINKCLKISIKYLFYLL